MLFYMNNYLIEGISGTGKTTVREELQKRGFKALEADEVFGFYGDPETGQPSENKSQLNWIWDKNRIEKELGNKSGEIIFVCGGAMNQDDFAHYFKKIFTLHVDDNTLRNRLLERTNNPFGKDPEDLARQLEWNQGAIEYSKKRDAILIDAAESIDKIVDKILYHTEVR